VASGRVPTGQGAMADPMERRETSPPWKAGDRSWWNWWETPQWPWYDWFQGLSRCLSFFFAALRIYIGFQYSVLWLNGASGEEQEAQERQLHRRCAERALELVLSMKGYYIKAAQTLCGSAVFPDEFDDVFSVLLDQCPKEPFEVVREILEAELGCPLDEIFQEFGTDAVAAASIGQVHFASLRDGSPVAVKVQYPDVERYFRMDVKSLEFLMWLQGAGAKVKELCEGMGLQFEAEFDYRKEARHCREIAECVLPQFRDRIAIPLPIDAAHPSSAQLGGRSLCTRKVVVMERLEGVPIRVHSMELMEMFAKAHGTTLKEIRKLARARKAEVDDSVVHKLMSMGPVSEAAALAAIAGVKVYNCCSGCGGGGSSSSRRRKLMVPLNGPRIARLLFEVHGHEIFAHGIFNSDPHAGNVFVMKDGRLGLLDYGAVMRLTPQQRVSMARLIVAVADEDDDSVPDAMYASGFRSRDKNPKLALLMGYMSFHRGPYPADLERLAPKVGFPPDIDVMGIEEYITGSKLDEMESFPVHLLMLQRCCMVLSGIGMELGAGRLSSARMLRPQAAKLLRDEWSK